MDSESAADMAAEAVARAFANWRQVEAYAGAWVARVATNLALDTVRRAPEKLGTLIPQPGPSPDRIALASAISRLPRRQQEAVVLRYMLDYDEAETATILGLSVGSVHTYVTRGLSRLRRDLPGDFLREREMK